ncbi:MAG: SDR family NAD(P)-dependent oxidoreductase [Actinobacteria bacterium]|nr:SDR family NAD(P)-dependent oxidoreductase [Actinomycetota bacterium]
MSRALVTGASGFIGSHLSRRLVESGAETHAVSRRARSDGEARWWQVDLTDADAVERLVDRVRPDVIYHLAGHVSGSRSIDAVIPSLQQNLVAAVHVLVAAARSGSRVVLAGSMEEEVTFEARPPSSPYAAAKEAATSFGRMLAALHRLPVVNIRLFMVYGPGQADHTKLVPYVVTSFLRGEKPQLASGSRPVDWIYVDDAVDAFVAAGHTSDLAGETIDVGSGELVTIRSIVEQIAEVVGTDVEPEFGALPERPLETIRVADLERSRVRLGWKPTTPLTDGLRATVDAYRDEFAHIEPPVRERGGV